MSIINTVFSSFHDILDFLFRSTKAVWDAVGNFTPIFLGLFATIIAFRFIIYPFLGGGSFGVPNWSREQKATETTPASSPTMPGTNIPVVSKKDFASSYKKSSHQYRQSGSYSNRMSRPSAHETSRN